MGVRTAALQGFCYSCSPSPLKEWVGGEHPLPNTQRRELNCPEGPLLNRRKLAQPSWARKARAKAPLAPPAPVELNTKPTGVCAAILYSRVTRLLKASQRRSLVPVPRPGTPGAVAGNGARKASSPCLSAHPPRQRAGRCCSRAEDGAGDPQMGSPKRPPIQSKRNPRSPLPRWTREQTVGTGESSPCPDALSKGL